MNYFGTVSVGIQPTQPIEDVDVMGGVPSAKTVCTSTNEGIKLIGNCTLPALASLILNG